METWWFPTVSNHAQFYMDVSSNGGTPKSIHFNRVFHYKPSILGYPYFWKHPHSYTGNKQPAVFLASQARDGGSFVDWVTFTMRLWRLIFFGEKNPWLFGRCTLRKFNSSPLKSYLPSRKVAFQPSFFSGYVKLWGGNFGEVRSKSNPSYILVWGVWM